MSTDYGKKLWPLNLQFFADEPPANPEPDKDGDESTPPANVLTEEEFQKRWEAELQKIQTKHQADIEAARSEAEKLAKMTADEKAKFEFEQREKQLLEKEQFLAQRELKAETLKALSDKQLPAEIIDIVLADNAENTAKNIESFKTVFDKAVQIAVEQRLAGTSPQIGSGTETKGTEEQVRSTFSNALKGGLR